MSIELTLLAASIFVGIVHIVIVSQPVALGSLNKIASITA